MMAATTTADRARKFARTLRGVYAGRSQKGLLALYASDARFRCALPGREADVVGAGPASVQLTASLPISAKVVAWNATPMAEGLYIEAELRPASRPGLLPERHTHLLQFGPGGVTSHLLLPARPLQEVRLSWPDWEFLKDASHRRRLSHGGDSGAVLEQARLRDGTRIVIKHIRPSQDWLMRATHDQGREAQLWLSGHLRDLDGVDYPVLAAAPEEDGWVIVLRDVSRDLMQPGKKVSRAEAVRLLAGADLLHRAFEGREVDGLSSLADRTYVFSPALVRAEREGIDRYPKLIGLGWERFAEVVPRQLGAVILRLVEDPTPLIRELEKGPLSLIHGDYTHGNIGIAKDGRVVMIDFAMASQAPPEVELTWYLNICAPDVDASTEELIADWQRIRGDDFDPSRLRLALLYEVVMSGYGWAYVSHWSPNPARRAQKAAELEWWLTRAAEALESWTPHWA
jgi:Phosphotransferase enzyme family